MVDKRVCFNNDPKDLVPKARNKNHVLTEQLGHPNTSESATKPTINMCPIFQVNSLANLCLSQRLTILKTN